MKSLEVSEDHIRVEDMLVDLAKDRREDSIEDRLGGEVTQSIGHPAFSVTGDVIARTGDVIVGAVEMRGEVVDCSDEHLTAHGFTCLHNQLPGLVHLVAEHVPVYLYADSSHHRTIRSDQRSQSSAAWPLQRI